MLKNKHCVARYEFFPGYFEYYVSLICLYHMFELLLHIGCNIQNVQQYRISIHPLFKYCPLDLDRSMILSKYVLCRKTPKLINTNELFTMGHRLSSGKFCKKLHHFVTELTFTVTKFNIFLQKLILSTK